jgi:hypothetical protein
VAAGASGEESAWHDLIANFAVEPDPAGGEPPWPERENLPAPSHAGPAADSGPDTDPDLHLDLTDGTGPEYDFGAGPDGLLGPPPRGPAGPGPADGGTGPGSTGPGGSAPGNTGPGSTGPGSTAPGSTAPGSTAPGSTGPGTRSGRRPSQPRIIRPASAVPPPPASDEGDFVPPVPPPLPTLDPVAKGAWVALFGGPAYLLIATMAGWAVPGWAAFLAVAAFVAGFATLVIRMGDRPPRDSGPDDGAVL